jgi:hypothetical protein
MCGCSQMKACLWCCRSQTALQARPTSV